MNRLFLSAIILLSCNMAKAQYFHLSLFTGICNYQGDLQPKEFTFQQSKVAYGVGVLYELSDQLNLRANVTFSKIQGADKNYEINKSRNLSFSSPLTDIHLGLEYDFKNSYDYALTPFIFGGASFCLFDPSTIDSTGGEVFLQPLGTEGQGFYQGRSKYNLTQFAIPIGVGLKYSFSENIKLRFEIGYRKTFTDYLDDVSSQYVDRALLLANNGARAVDLAFRGDELDKKYTYPNNAKRGNPNRKDAYYFIGLGMSFRLSDY